MEISEVKGFLLRREPTTRFFQSRYGGRGMRITVKRAWAGGDVGKEFSRVHLLDTSGAKILSRRVENDRTDISGPTYENLFGRGGNLGSRSK